MKIINSIRDLFNDRVYIKKTAYIALPVAFNEMLNMLVNLADSLMIGRLGEKEIASVGLANRIFFIFILLIFGISSGSGILTSQYWGIKDIKSIRKVLGMALIPIVIVSALFTLMGIFMPTRLLLIFTNDISTASLGALYLSVVCLSYPFAAISRAYAGTLRSIGVVTPFVIITGITMAINIVLNYVLIFGKWGAPMLGITGAAYATLIARICELIMLFGVLIFTGSPIICSFREMFTLKKELLNQFISNALPVVSNEFMWALGTAMYSAAYGRMGDVAVAAMTMSAGLQDMLFVSFTGLAAATAVILGNELGAGHLKKAKVYSVYSFILSIIFGLLTGVIIIILSPTFISLYNIGRELARSVSLCLLMYAIYDFAKAFNTINIVGVLRSGGDTRYCFFLDMTGVWLIGLPMAFIGGLVLKLPIHWVLALVLTEELYKMVLGYKRYKKGLWLKNLTL